MIKEIIARTKLIADEGMILTDGENYGKIIYLASDANGDKWYEIPQSEYDAMMAERENLVDENNHDIM